MTPEVLQLNAKAAGNIAYKSIAVGACAGLRSDPGIGVVGALADCEAVGVEL